MSDLYTALEAAIRARLEVARAADLTGLDSWYSVSDLVKEHRFGGAGLSNIDAGYIALHDPADAIRRYAADLEILDRYRRLNAEGEGWLTHDEIYERNAQLELMRSLLDDLLDVYPEVARNA